MRQLLLLGGLDAAKNTTGEILRIDPAAGTVTATGTLAVPVHDAAGAIVAGRPTVFGGGNSSESAAVQALDADGRVQRIGELPVPRSDLAAATVGGRVVPPRWLRRRTRARHDDRDDRRRLVPTPR